MQSLFLTEEDVFEVKICVGEDSEGSLYCDISKEGVRLILGENESEIKEYTISFKKPSFGDLRDLTDSLMETREVNGKSVEYDSNPIAMRIKTIYYLIRDWDFTDTNGEKIKITEENIKKLNPIIASAIGIQIDDYLSIGDEPDIKSVKEE